MTIEDFDKQYQTKTDDELMQLATESDQLTAEARDSLANELSRRRVKGSQVNAYRENKQSQRQNEKNWNPEAAYFLWPGLRRVRATLADWQKYKRQTGEWPRLSIAFYFAHAVLGFLVLVTVGWYGVQHRWSGGRFILIVLPLIVADIFVSDRLQRKLRSYETARHRSAAIANSYIRGR